MIGVTSIQNLKQELEPIWKRTPTRICKNLAKSKEMLSLEKSTRGYLITNFAVTLYVLYRTSKTTSTKSTTTIATVSIVKTTTIFAIRKRLHRNVKKEWKNSFSVISCRW